MAPIVVSAPAVKPLVVAPLPALVPDRLPHTFQPTSYAARLRVDPAAVQFTGTIEIAGVLAEPSALIWINAEDLAITRVTAMHDGVQVPMAATVSAAKRGWLALQSEQPLAPGAWQLTIDYAGAWNDKDAWGGFRQPKSGNPRDQGGERYVFTQFEPDYARTVYPCFDEPDRKVPWQLTLDVPEALVAASNTPIESEQHRAPSSPTLPALKTASSPKLPAMKTVRFAKTPPLPSYLIAFAVGPFEIVDAGRSKTNIPITILTPRGDRELAAHAAAAAPQLLDKLETWLGVPFPYPKVDFVAVPRTANWWAAMENPGLVLFGAYALHDAAAFDGLAAHELAHHWFGDLVTLAWWDDIWLNESFAYWIGSKIAGEARFDPASAAGPLVDDATRNPRLQLGAWGAYQAVHKGAQLLALLDAAVGSDRLVALLRRYLAAHAHGSVRTADLRAAIADGVGEAIAQVVDRYASASTEPLSVELQCTANSRRVEVKGFGTTGLVCVAYDRAGVRDERCGTLAWGSAALELPVKHCPRWVLPRAPQEIKLSLAQLEAIRDHGWAALTTAERWSLLSYVLAHDPTRGRLRLSYIAMAASSADDAVLSWITTYLASIDRQVPASQRARYDAWISSLFAVRARTFGIDREPDRQRRATYYPLLSLVLSARDRDFTHEALALLPKLDQLDAPARVLVLRAAIIDNPALADDLVAEIPKARPQRMADIAFALEATPSLLELMQKHVAEIKLLQPYQRSRLFGQLCDETRRSEVEQLGRDIFPKPDPALLRDYEWCVQEQKALEPELRAFFAAAGQLRH